jgi:hypothetical protein
MTGTNGIHASVRRLPGESADRWLQRAHEAHREAGMERKIVEGRWLPPDEFERLMGRPGRRLDGEEIAAGTAAGTAAAPPPAAEAPGSRGPDAELPSHPMRAVAQAALIGAAVDMAQAALRRERAGDVALHGLKAATKSVARSAVREGIERAIGRKVGEAAARGAIGTVVRGSIVGEVSCAVVEQGIDTVRLLQGDISKGEYGERSLANVVGAGGSIGGTYLGATIGTALLPGVGTAIGGFVGGWLSGTGARAVVRWMMN